VANTTSSYIASIEVRSLMNTAAKECASLGEPIVYALVRVHQCKKRYAISK